MATLLLKLILTPSLLGAATLAARRWGPSVGGWLVGLPLTSGPLLFFLALDHGRAFAAATSTGSIAGAAAEAGFCLAYAAVGRRASWLPALVAGSLGYVAASVAIQPALMLPLAGELMVVGLVLGLSLRLIPASRLPHGGAEPPAWDLPARMIVGTAIVIVLAAAAPALGPHATGIIAAFPVYAAVLAGFTHHLEGPDQAMDVLRGLLVGLFAFSGFFAVIDLALLPFGIAAAFGAAVAAALLIQGATFSARWVGPRAPQPS